MNIKKIGENIKKHRKARGLTQKDLATKIRRTESSVRKYEKGLVDIPNKIISEISEALDVPISQLIQDTPFSLLESSINTKRTTFLDLASEIKKKEMEFHDLVNQKESNPEDEDLDKRFEKSNEELQFLYNQYSQTQYALNELVKELKDGQDGISAYEKMNDIFSTEEGKAAGRKLIDELTEIDRKNLEASLLTKFNKLNPSGKNEAIKRVDELTQLPTYTKDETTTNNFDGTE